MVVGLTLSQLIMIPKGAGGLGEQGQAWLAHDVHGLSCFHNSKHGAASGCKAAWKGLFNELVL